MSNKIANTMIRLLCEQNKTSVWYGDIEIIERCAILCNATRNHPKKTIAYVLNSLERSPIFHKGYVEADFDGYKRRYRCFSIKNVSQQFDLPTVEKDQ